MWKDKSRKSRHCLFCVFKLLPRKTVFGFIFGIVMCGFMWQFFIVTNSAYAESPTTELTNSESEADGCFVILIGKDRTIDGSVMVAHNEDGSNKSSRLKYVPKQHNPEQEMYLNYVTIPQVPETLAYWAEGFSTATAARPEYDDEWILNGMNEAGVSITCAVTRTRQEPPPEKQGITRFALRQVVLERATSARDGVDIFSNLISEYGLALSPEKPQQTIACGVADSQEAWLIESTFHQWVAKKIPDDSYSASGNVYTIGSDWDLASPDLIEYAIEQGWYNPEQGPFSFKDAYSSTEEPDLAHSAARVWQTQVMLDQQEGGSVDVPFLWSIISQPPVQSRSTQAFMIWHLRDTLPKELGTLMWFGLSNAVTNVRIPIYMGSTESPPSYMDSSGSYDPSSAYWQFRLAGITLYPQPWIYVEPFKKVRQKLDGYQFRIDFKNKWIEWLAPIYYEFGGINALENLLTDYTYKELQSALDITNNIIKKYQFKLPENSGPREGGGF
ncbi:C69 family dipeptidase [Patescibacteria group bacterium]